MSFDWREKGVLQKYFFTIILNLIWLMAFFDIALLWTIWNIVDRVLLWETHMQKVLVILVYWECFWKYNKFLNELWLRFYMWKPYKNRRSSGPLGIKFLDTMHGEKVKRVVNVLIEELQNSKVIGDNWQVNAQ